MPISAINTTTSELAQLVDRLTMSNGVFETANPGLALVRLSEAVGPMISVQEPALCVIVQGRKQVTLGEEQYIYDDEHYMLVSVDLPITGQVLEASPERPYLSLRLDLDLKIVADLLAAGAEVKPSEGRALSVSRLEPELIDSLTRLVKLLDTPQHVAALSPLIEREILYRLLVSPGGDQLRQIALGWGSAARIARATDLLRRKFAHPLKMEELATEVGMSISGLHHHFKQVTAMSPLQFQKRLRLQEARRLMFSEGLDASGAAFQVGYESPSQFNREYRRLFGAPPVQDVSRLKERVLTTV